MNIILSQLNQSFFRHLKCGDTFMYKHNVVWLKIRPVDCENNYTINAVTLNEGDTDHFGDNDIVNVVKGAFVQNYGETQ